MDKGGRGHLASAFSLIEILRVLYDDVLAFRASEPRWSDRDRCILSKGHGCLALYAILADKGFFDPSELDRFCHFDSMLGGHPERDIVPGVEATTGALGHGLSIGVGIALAGRLRNATYKTFVVMGDGEINEGSVWEAMMCASARKLGNLVAIVDYNKMQSYGPTGEVLDLEPLADKWTSFGARTLEVDGHDIGAIRAALDSVDGSADRPTAIICHTVKGRGVASIEGDATWHHKSRLAPEVIEGLYAELDS